MYKRLPVVNKALCKLNENIPANAIGIHGILYDVSKLNHPGGHVFINMSLGTDATLLFETHHLDIDKAKHIAEKLTNEKFYKLCMETTQKLYEQHYTEEVFLKNWKRIWS